MSNFRLDGRALTDTEYLRFMRYLEQEAYDDADAMPTLSVLPPATPPSLHRLADRYAQASGDPAAVCVENGASGYGFHIPTGVDQPIVPAADIARLADLAREALATPAEEVDADRGSARPVGAGEDEEVLTPLEAFRVALGCA